MNYENYMQSELNVRPDNYIYQSSELLEALLPHLEFQERYEDCAKIVKIIKNRQIINLK